jgi:hypothetical protein
MGWENVKYFLGSSYQTHTEMFNSEAGLRSLNKLQQTTHLLLGLSSAGPFANGKVKLSNEDIPGMEKERERWQSVRFLGRKHGSPSGGVIQFPAHDTLKGYLNAANVQLASQETPTPARLYGHHADLRYRPDIKPGTIELATLDNFGAAPVKMAAITEFNKALIFKTQYLIHTNRVNELPSNIFSELNEDRLRIIEEDTIKISKDGLDTDIRDAQGNLVNARGLFNQLKDWVNKPLPEANYHGLPDGVTEELTKSSETVDFNQEGTRDEKFLGGYYKTGRGTLSQWLHVRVNHLRSQEGLGEKEAVTRCVNELSVEWYKHIHDNEVEERIVNMFI